MFSLASLGGWCRLNSGYFQRLIPDSDWPPN